MTASELHARPAYDALADVYDGLTAHHDYDRWLGLLEALALAHGLRGRRLLDVACGTGKSFIPLALRGYDVTACDLSAAMVDRARVKCDGLDVRLLVADMRALPAFGHFDLVTCLDDAVNYLCEPHELRAAFQSIRRNLSPGGLLIFDANTLATYRSMFATDSTWVHAGVSYTCRGHGMADAAPGSIFPATLEAWADGERLATSEHHQRHHPQTLLRQQLAAAGLQCLGVYGQLPDGSRESVLDESRHVKSVVIARRSEQ